MSGLGAGFAPHTGPVHRYIGASAACWDLYCQVQAGVEPDVARLASSTPPERQHATTTMRQDLGPLLVDAYAAQHHGVPSPQAIQSVAIHLVTLHGVIALGVGVEQALWIRQRGLRRRGVFEWLTPPAQTAFTLRHLFSAPGISPSDYVASVHAAWHEAHGARIEEWFRRFVLVD
jgi:hypothetical protein